MREKRQFRALVRLFAYRFFDSDLISLRGDLSSLLAQFAALLSAMSLVIVIIVGPKYAGLYQHLTPAQLPIARWCDQEFLFSTSMAIIGIFTLLLWDVLFPDRRDCLILGAMPLRVRHIFIAKLAALGSALSLAVLAANSFSGLLCPFLLSAGIPPLIAFVSYWLVLLLACAFVFLLLLGLQGIALHVLPHHLFQRWSSLIQTAAFFAVLALYFLTPPLTGPRALHAWIPSHWFFSLFQVLAGSRDVLLTALAWRAIEAVAATALIALAAYTLAYSRQMRRTVEQSGIAPPGRVLIPWIAIVRRCARRPSERAILGFIGRTLARSRHHRLLLSIYTGMGLAYVFSQAAYVLYHHQAYGAAASREQTALGMPLILLFFLIIGQRVSFSIPVELRANWLFRVTEPFSRGAALSSTRKALLLFAVAPVALIAAPASLAFWPWPKALEHTIFLVVFGLLIVELALTRFAKVPFTCSYLPGRANLKIMFGVYWGLVIIVSEIVTDIEQRALRDLRGYMLLIAITLISARLAARHAPAAVNFDEQPESVVVDLGLVEHT